MIAQIISDRLQSIEQNARQTLRDIEFIRGFCAGMETVANDYPTPSPTLQCNQEAIIAVQNKYGETVRVDEYRLREVQQ